MASSPGSPASGFSLASSSSPVVSGLSARRYTSPGLATTSPGSFVPLSAHGESAVAGGRLKHIPRRGASHFFRPVGVPEGGEGNRAPPPSLWAAATTGFLSTLWGAPA